MNDEYTFYYYNSQGRPTHYTIVASSFEKAVSLLTPFVRERYYEVTVIPSHLRFVPRYLGASH